MGSIKRHFKVESQQALKPQRMKILALFIFFLALLNLAEAGCDENGCCFCTSETGEVITATKGPYRQNCNDEEGLFCSCGWNVEQEFWYGKCTKARQFNYPVEG